MSSSGPPRLPLRALRYSCSSQECNYPPASLAGLRPPFSCASPFIRHFSASLCRTASPAFTVVWSPVSFYGLLFALPIPRMQYGFLALAGPLSPPKIHTDRKSTRLNSSHQIISYAVFCLKKKSINLNETPLIVSPSVVYQIGGIAVD